MPTACALSKEKKFIKLSCTSSHKIAYISLKKLLKPNLSNSNFLAQPLPCSACCHYYLTSGIKQDYWFVHLPKLCFFLSFLFLLLKKLTKLKWKCEVVHFEPTNEKIVKTCTLRAICFSSFTKMQYLRHKLIWVRCNYSFGCSLKYIPKDSPPSFFSFFNAKYIFCSFIVTRILDRLTLPYINEIMRVISYWRKSREKRMNKIHRLKF